MFTKSSRYYSLDTVQTEDAAGRSVQAVKLRALGAPAAAPTRVRDGDQLDVMSESLYREATRFWHIGDANSELEVNELTRVAGRVIGVPER